MCGTYTKCKREIGMSQAIDVGRLEQHSAVEGAAYVDRPSAPDELDVAFGDRVSRDMFPEQLQGLRIKNMSFRMNQVTFVMEA
jgi:hypothetical protein